MSKSDATSPPTLGFLTVVEHETLGLTGGYLILNTAGRPLEFHCTAPVKPNRAQQILFGPTLETYLYGEQIGQTLVAKGSAQPLVVCTDVAAALSVREFVGLPVALVLAGDRPAESSSAAGVNYRVDAAHAGFALGRNRLSVAIGRDDDRQAIETRLASLVAFDLFEPFGRIREAIEEAHKGRS
jgi:hypothetical protein